MGSYQASALVLAGPNTPGGLQMGALLSVFGTPNFQRLVTGWLLNLNPTHDANPKPHTLDRRC